MNNKKRLIILLIFVISLLSFSSFFTISRYVYKKSLTGNINSKVIKIEFEPNGDTEYKESQSSIVTVTHKAGTNFSTLKYVWSTNNDTDASDGIDFLNGDEIIKAMGEGEYYLCVYAEDINGLHNNVCSNKFNIDAKGPDMSLSHEYENGNYYIVVEVNDNATGIKDVISNESSTFDHTDGNKYYFNVVNGSNLSFTAIDNLDNSTTMSYDLCHEIEGTVYNYSYTGSIQNFKVVCDGLYAIEVWGAQGGTANSTYVGGNGGYSTGNKNLAVGNNLYIGVGGQGSTCASSSTTCVGGFNGGGSGKSYSESASVAAGGGGATHVALNNNLGELKNYNSSRNSIIIVAGGGGGGHYTNDYNSGIGGTGGGTDGGNPTQLGPHSQQVEGRLGKGATSSGPACTADDKNCGGFGYGGNSDNTVDHGAAGSGGGAGYFGGSGANIGAGGGGTGYVGGVENGSTVANQKTGNGQARIKYLGSSVNITFDYNYNFIPNGDFSNGLTGWSAKNAGTITLDNSLKSPDNHSSVKVCGSNTWAGIFRDDVSPALGEKMRLTFKMYRKTDISYFNVGVSLHYGSNDTHYNPGINYGNGSPVNTWTTLTVDADIPSSINDFRVYGNFNQSISTEYCVWVAELNLSIIKNAHYAKGYSFETLANPTRNGYIFEGWYTAPVGGTKIDSTSIVPNSDTTYYAHWRVPKIVTLESWQRPEGDNVSTTKFTIGSNTYTSNSSNIIGGTYWYGNKYTNINVLGGTQIYITSGYGAQTRWYTANSEDAYLCTGSRLVGTMPNSDISIFVYPDVQGHDNTKRRVISGLTNLRCG